MARSTWLSNRIGRVLRPLSTRPAVLPLGGPNASLIAALSLRKKRFLFLGGLAGLLLLVAVVLGILGLGGAGVAGVALGGHQLVQFAGSADFCTGCHNVHYAEAVTRQASPHSEVACASCHVGEGTAAIFMSKVRGLRDIVPAVTGRYERPIPTPLKQRRPSSETCEKCHWAEKFFGDEVRVRTSFAADESNSVETRALVLKVDGGKKEVAEGIHWHSTARVWYLPLDDRLLKIGWVGVEDETGNVVEYVDPNRAAEVTPQRILAEKRLMDCMDCHNRVTHLVRSPDELVDAALADGSIDVSLPFIKREAIGALVPQNASLDQAYAAVEKVKEFYQASYPDILRDRADVVDSAIVRLKEIARFTTFPDGLDWIPISTTPGTRRRTPAVRWIGRPSPCWMTRRGVSVVMGTWQRVKKGRATWRTVRPVSSPRPLVAAPMLIPLPLPGMLLDHRAGRKPR